MRHYLFIHDDANQNCNLNNLIENRCDQYGPNFVANGIYNPYKIIEAEKCPCPYRYIMRALVCKYLNRLRQIQTRV